MPHATLSQTSYGKSDIRLVQVTRRGDRHERGDLAVAVRFEGDDDSSYSAGDNSAVLPTDTMKNTVYALAAGDRVREPESFGLLPGRHFLEAFATHDSLSVQHTPHAMGQAVLDTVDAVAAISLVMPNRHHLPVDLSRLGLVNRNEIFVAVDEPFGLIEATLSR